MSNLETLAGTAPWQWPDSAHTMLLEVLRNPDSPPSERVLAAELLAHVVVMDDQVAHALLSIVQDSAAPDALRAQAATSLGPILEEADEDGFDDADVPIAEKTFREIQRTLHGVYAGAAVPKEVRRRALEAAVRAPQEWQKAAVRWAWASGDREWKVTAVFCMAHIRGFEDEILDALDSPDEDIHYHAVTAAGEMEVKRAWRHIVSLLTSADIDKALLLAAIDAAATIRPADAAEVLGDLIDHHDPDVIEAVHEALTMARGLAGAEDEDDAMDDEKGDEELDDDLDEDLEEEEDEDWGDDDEDDNEEGDDDEDEEGEEDEEDEEDER